jgi:hypothetical protein
MRCLNKQGQQASLKMTKENTVLTKVKKYEEGKVLSHK